MDIIQQLKVNCRPFGLMSEEMQEKAKEIGEEVFNWWVAGDWTICPVAQFRSEATYRLCADYEEEPEIVECEIYLNPPNKEYCIYDKGGNHSAQNLCNAINDPDFIGFKKDGWIWGRLYRNKKDPSMVHYMIKETDLPLYEVISMVGGKVLFRRAK